MTGFIASKFLSRNRVSLKEAFEGLELCERKLSCTVLRGLDGSNPVRLLDLRTESCWNDCLKEDGAASSEAAEWYAINWQSIHQDIHRLQVRIVQATKAGR